MRAATGLDLSFQLPDGHGQGSSLYFLSPENEDLSVRELWDQVGLFTPQTVAAITVFGSYLGKSGPLADQTTLSLVFPYSGRQEVEWTAPDRAGAGHVRSIVGSDLPYDDSYCAFPELRVLRYVGAGSDFGRVSECNPELEELGITAWQDSTGQAALAGLKNLEILDIEGVFDDPSALSSLRSLQTLRVELANDTPEARREARALMPDCDIEFI
ncbi:MAG: hypothetical protein LBO20_05225 [Bifidobacteriaceae bacterium]|nr:hypothetical protein [Bifidobacteriaceae bacterium]